MKQMQLSALGAALVLILTLAPSPAHSQITHQTPQAGSGAQDPCAGSQAQVRVTVDQVSVEDGVIKANGTWTVSGGATGALIEVRMDADRWQSETFQGTKGTWSFAQAFKWEKCGHYSLRVYGYPSLSFHNHLYSCLERDNSMPWRFDIPCSSVAQLTHCEWECEDKQCSGICSASAAAGVAPYQPLWGLNNKDYKPGKEVSNGPWAEAVQCTLGDKVSFRVREGGGSGKLSNPVYVACGEDPAGKP